MLIFCQSRREGYTQGPSQTEKTPEMNELESDIIFSKSELKTSKNKKVIVFLMLGTISSQLSAVFGTMKKIIATSKKQLPDWPEHRIDPHKT